MADFFGDMFGMNDGDMDNLLERHPLTVFSRLAYDEPDNKVYRQCLENEIQNAAESLSDSIGDAQIVFIEHMLDALPAMRERKPPSDDEEREMLKDIEMKVDVIRRIMNAIRKIHENGRGNDISNSRPLSEN